MGIAMACLVENDQRDLVDWTREVSDTSITDTTKPTTYVYESLAIRSWLS